MNVQPTTLLPWRADRDAALPPHACIEVVEAPAFVPVPGGPYYALGLMPWRGGRIPLLDLEVLLRAVPRAGPAQPPRWALVVAWPSPDGQGSASARSRSPGCPRPSRSTTSRPARCRPTATCGPGSPAPASATAARRCRCWIRRGCSARRTADGGTRTGSGTGCRRRGPGRRGRGVRPAVGAGRFGGRCAGSWSAARHAVRHFFSALPADPVLPVAVWFPAP